MDFQTEAKSIKEWRSTSDKQPAKTFGMSLGEWFPHKMMANDKQALYLICKAVDAERNEMEKEKRAEEKIVKPPHTENTLKEIVDGAEEQEEDDSVDLLAESLRTLIKEAEDLLASVEDKSGLWYAGGQADAQERDRFPAKTLGFGNGDGGTGRT
ncbi:hypothetical protein QFC24_004989 [Naganishia onofrii]|uniref:Uncharacterized protein n=1 Tax=Naganishia onofrii TaxID=1851511 RepID=A0ACC2XCA3_9TREE|nr:hypothetical protein QFC24_004989 [Naganishia onofrii]